METMKRLSVISLLAAMPLAMSASYGDYGYEPKPSGFILVLMIVLLVWGILEVILFFKVWGMTNNVEKIKKNMLRSNTQELLRKYRLFGQNDKAAEIVIQDFLFELEKYVNSMDYQATESIEKDVEGLEAELSQLGVKLPEEFRKLKVAKDYYDLGTMKKFGSHDAVVKKDGIKWVDEEE